jgi:hypothetical protein
MMLVKLIMLGMLNIVVMVTGILYVYHTRCVHYGDYDKCALVGKIWKISCIIKVNKKLKTERTIKNGQPKKQNWQPRVHKTKYKTKQKHNTLCVGHHYA